ncbi:Mitotic-spindle organizing protein 1 [Sergentomyia squamirostris]
MMPPKDGDNEIFTDRPDAESVRLSIQNISQLLDTGLSAECLDICMRLCESGVSPQALADIIIQIRREVGGLRGNEE